jgi:uncharacterized membrane protein YcaP (DUF421 family)
MEFFQSGWPSVARTLLIGGIAYLSLIAFLRIVGKRTLSKMNAFDFVVTIALGSTLSAAFVYRSVDVIQSVLAIGYLILLQYLVATLSVRSERFQSLIKSQPVLLVSNGRVLEKALRQERLTREEIYAGIRSKGFRRLEDVGAVVLETDGNLSVLPLAKGEVELELRGVQATGFQD